MSSFDVRAEGMKEDLPTKLEEQFTKLHSDAGTEPANEVHQLFRLGRDTLDKFIELSDDDGYYKVALSAQGRVVPEGHTENPERYPIIDRDSLYLYIEASDQPEE